QKAVANTMKGFPIDNSHPFYSVNPNVGGLSHGLTFTDVLEELYRMTKDQKYLDYALFLYKDFSSQVLNEDAQYAKLLQKDLMLKGHGVHTYEHLRSLAAAAYASGNPELQKALKDFMEKITLTTTASGGPVGDEWIGGRKADATSRGYEYCSLQELMHSYESLYAKSGSADHGDKVENLFFNAAQGARNPGASCIAYLKSDNSYAMTGGLNGDESDPKQTRYHYSPVHKEAAVCCVPNAGRIAPYYVNYMWMKDDKSIIASLLGPSQLTTLVKGKMVNIREMTKYPYENTIIFEVIANVTFDLKIRKPEWAKTFKLNAAYKEADGYIIISKKWSGKQQIRLEFFPHVTTEQDVNGEYFFRYGSLVLAHKIAAIPTITKTYSLSGFTDIEYSPTAFTVYEYNDAPIKSLGNGTFETALVDPKSGKSEKVILEPMGQTILRQTTFKKHQP
ncbi:MAG TPA: beta-L-arabinofuranosidase domain-containing protein, partial [Flavobacterium sp.]|nr:beta-L-arabinofuranosidase domain-containing protein [Flavobacterium sp.]